MPGPVSREHALDAILKGIKKANADYYAMSGSWIWDGPEYWITTYVARSLWKKFGDSNVVCEGGSKATLKDAGQKVGRPPLLVMNKRYDIVLYFQNGSPRAVIEVKNDQPKGEVLKDVKRVVAALNAAKLRFAAVAYYCCYSNESEGQKAVREKINGYADRIEDGAAEIVGKKYTTKHSKRYVSVEGNDAWLAGCILIERKQSPAL